MKKIIFGALAAISLSSPAMAADDFKAGNWMLRARALGVVPNESGHVSNGDSVSIDNSVVPELDVSYFFTSNVSAELIAAVTPHNVKTSSGIDAGSSWLLPPTLTLQYHFTQVDSIKPYVGAGVNDIAWLHASLPQSATRHIVAEIEYPLMAIWFKQQGFSHLTNALNNVFSG